MEAPDWSEFFLQLLLLVQVIPFLPPLFSARAMTGGRGGKSTLSQTVDTETTKSVDNFSVNSANSAVNSIDNHKDSETEVDPVASDSSRGVDLNPSAWRHMEKLISKQVSITVEKQTRQINDRIDSLSSRIEGIRDTYETQINEIKQKLTDPDLKTDEAQNLRLTAAETEIKLLKDLSAEKNRCDEFLNYHHLIAGVQREQRDRMWSCRVYNFQAPWESKQLDVEGVYNQLIRPVLDKVVSTGDKPYPTDFHSIIERGHPLAARKSEIAPFIFRFHSRRFLYDFMLNKRPHVESLIAKAANKSLWTASSAVKYDPKKRLRVAHDLAQTNRQCMSFLHMTGLASKCKTTSVGVSFKPKGLKTGWVKVTNPFSSTLEGLVKPLPHVNSLLSAKALIFDIYDAANRDSYIKKLNINVEDIYRASAKQRTEDPGSDEEDDEAYPEAAARPPTGEETRTEVNAVSVPAAAKGKRQAQSAVTRAEAKKSAATSVAKK